MKHKMGIFFLFISFPLLAVQTFECRRALRAMQYKLEQGLEKKPQRKRKKRSHHRRKTDDEDKTINNIMMACGYCGVPTICVFSLMLFKLLSE